MNMNCQLFHHHKNFFKRKYIGIVVDNDIIYYSNHLGTSSFVTDGYGDPTQFYLNFPFGEIEERDSSRPLKKN